ncbi:MAG: hypothetical protein ACLGPL_11340 [Acidobacteriota bacterium]
MDLKALLIKKQELLDQKAEIEESLRPRIAPIAEELATVEKAINDRARELFRAVPAQKDTGTFNLMGDGVSIKVTISKTVKWDQAKLSEIHSLIASSGDDPSQYIGVTYGVSENAFKAWPDQIKNVFMPARTVTPGAPKFELEIVGEDDIPF